MRKRLLSEGLHLPITRWEFLSKAARSESILEIGPFDRPRLRGRGVSYFDVLDTDALRARALEIGRNPEMVPSIDYVSADGDLSAISNSFDAALSCHSLEHQPNLIGHFAGVASILRPGSRYYVILPDKRFTFDHFLPESTIDDVMAAHSEDRKVHSPRSIAHHFLQTTHNDVLRHWLGLHGQPRTDNAQHRLAENASARAAAGEYIDVHAWAFSPSGFLNVLRSLRDAELIPFKSIEVHETGFLDGEFYAVLTF